MFAPPAPRRCHDSALSIHTGAATMPVARIVHIQLWMGTWSLSFPPLYDFLQKVVFFSRLNYENDFARQPPRFLALRHGPQLGMGVECRLHGRPDVKVAGTRPRCVSVRVRPYAPKSPAGPTAHSQLWLSHCPRRWPARSLRPARRNCRTMLWWRPPASSQAAHHTGGPPPTGAFPLKPTRYL